MGNDSVRMGVMGCGGFAHFAMEHYAQVPGFRVAAVADVNPAAAESLAKATGGQVVPPGDLASHDDVNWIYIATPPWLHHEEAMDALQAGKHVIVEKPLAVSDEQADEIVALARDKKRVLATNLMQRYNPLAEQVKAVVDTGVLGDPLHGIFENYACDQQLGPDHWFWKEDQSGGIFIEHSVHFFDLFEYWLGEGQVVSAQRGLRPHGGMEEQVQAAALYRNGTILANFYHGFHQPARMDRQTLRLVFERGDVTLDEWVPTRARVDALVDNGARDRLAEIFPSADFRTLERYSGEERQVRGRHRDFVAGERIEILVGRGVDKQARYGEMVRSLFEDQLAWTRAPQHVRRLDEGNGQRSLALAVRARTLSKQG